MAAHAAYLHREDVTRVLYEMKNVYVHEIEAEKGEGKGSLLYVKVPFDRNKIRRVSIDEFKEKIAPSIMKTMKPDSGRVGPFKIYSDGVLIGEGNMSENDSEKYEGEYKEYWPNGAVKKYVLFSNGVPQGDAVEYYNNGQISVVRTFKNGVTTDEKFYSKTGKRFA